MTTYPTLPTPAALVADILDRWARTAQRESELAADPADARLYRAEADRCRKALYVWGLGVQVQAAPRGGYLVPSASRGKLIAHLTTRDGCSCEAGRAGRRCYHRALVEAIAEAVDEWEPEAEGRTPEASPAPAGRMADRIAAARRARYGL